MSNASTIVKAAAPNGSFLRITANNQLRVIHALMLHDIKSRFFGNGLGYIATILWPSTHIAVIIGIFYFRGHQVPYGDSALLYAAIGVLPYIMWSYISRFTMLGTIQNKNFLLYPIVKPLDLMIARQALELVSSTIITICLFLFLLSCGINPMPLHVESAAFALSSAALLGIGFGIIGATIAMIFPLFNIAYVLVLILCWISCGLHFDPEALPNDVGYILSWNPLLHSVEWMRYAYFNDFPARLLSRSYVLGVGAGALTIGLVFERVMRHLTTR